MRGRTTAVLAALAVAAAVAAGCSDPPPVDDQAIPTTATTAAPTTVAPPTTATTAAPASTTTAAPATTTTVAYQGLPGTVPVPVAGLLTLTGGDTFSDGFLVTGVSGQGVLDWLVGALPSAGWEIVEQVADPGARRRFQGTVEFTGRGADGLATLSERPDGVAVEVVLSARHLTD